MLRFLVVVTALLGAGCGEPTTPAADARVDGDAMVVDASARRDAGARPDADVGLDAGAANDAGDLDASSGVDAGASVDASADLDANVDGGVDASCDSIACTPLPRPIAPLSTSTVTSTRPTLRWLLPSSADAALVELCTDRACAAPIASEVVAGTSFRPPAPLAPGAYFWRLRSMRGADTGADTSPVWQLRVGARDTGVDTSWGAQVDVNGDGYGDVLVGAYGVGDLFVYHGGAGGIATAPSQTISIPIGFDHGWGMPIASAGDLNGDGFGDVAVGELDPNGTSLAGGGYVYVYLGSASGLLEPYTRLRAPEVSSRFGGAMASAGDVDGDGYGDLAVGAFEARPIGSSGRSGQVYVYRGGPSGIATTPGDTLGPLMATGFGRSVAGADVDGDGYGDLVVSGGYEAAGSAHVYRGGPSGLALVSSHGAAEGVLASLVAAVDVDGDGYADLLATARTADAEVVTLVFPGGASGVAAASDARILHPAASDAAIAQVARGVGDVNGDGYADAAFGLPFANGQQGYVYLHHGSADGLSSVADTTFTNVDSGGFRAGVSLTGNDVDRDGFSDLFIGAEDLLAPIALPVYVGSVDGVSDEPTTSIPSPVGRSARFSASVE